MADHGRNGHNVWSIPVRRISSQPASKGRPAHLRAAATLGGLLVVLLIVSVAYAAVVDIDSFNDGTQNFWVDSSNPTSFGVYDTSQALGGERDIYLEWVSGTTQRVNIDVDYGGTSNRVAYTAGDGMYGRATISWDGNDDDGAILDNDGLNSVDLTGGGTNDGIVAQIINDDLPSILTLRVYADTAAANWSYYAVNVPPLNPGTRMDVFFPFSGFATGGGTGATFNSAGAVAAIVEDNGYASLDVSIDFIEASNAREYGDLPVATYGTGILSASHIPQGLRLGVNCDAETAYNSSTGADGDDVTSADDEDGVVPLGMPWRAGANGGRIRITLSGCADDENGCYVSGWIDWNRDGDFDDTVGGADEVIIPNWTYYNGSVSQYLNTPTSIDSGYYYARFRTCPTSTRCDSPTNSDTNVLNGEVEDYRWQPGPTAVDLLSFTAAPQSGRVVLRWETASEVSNAGFDLYRAESAGGVPVKLNQAIIPSRQPGSPAGAQYEYLDATAAPGVTYYYWLEAWDSRSGATRLGPETARAAYRLFVPLVAN